MKNKGITLIALVITIIIVILITGVSINMGLGENHSIIKEITEEIKEQQEMTNAEKGKTSNVIKNYEEEWGLS